MPTTTKVPLQTEELLKENPAPEKKTKRDLYPYLLALGMVFAVIFGVLLGYTLQPATVIPREPAEEEQKETEAYPLPEWITPAFLTVDGVSRSGEKLEAVRDLAVHYVANPGTSAEANRSYFEGAQSDTSAHFIVGLEGEILCLIPLEEKSVATNERNSDTISIEVCHPDASGEFSETTRESLIRLLAYLCEEYDLTEENLIRHYDVTGKKCPLYYVEHPEAWDGLKQDVKAALEKGE